MSGKISLMRAIALFLSMSTPVLADDAKVPFWGAVKAHEVNMRVGPGEAYRITWVYHRPFLPLKVLRTMENWWLVQDPDGARGWVLSSLMTKKRGALVLGNEHAEMRDKPDAASRVLWRLQPGVTGRLGECEKDWCHLELAGQQSGWVRREQLWGAADL